MTDGDLIFQKCLGNWWYEVREAYATVLCCRFIYVVPRSQDRSSCRFAASRDHISLGWLDRPEERHQRSIGGCSWRFEVCSAALFECTGFHFQIDLRVDLGRVY